MLALGFLPVLVVAGWVLLAMQPDGNWFRAHVLSWSSDAHIDTVVHDVGIWLGVLAFAIGYTLGAALEPAPRVVEEEVVAPPPTTAPRPTSPSRRSGARSRPVLRFDETETTTVRR